MASSLHVPYWGVSWRVGLQKPTSPEGIPDRGRGDPLDERYSRLVAELARAHHSIHADDAENQCPKHGRLPTDRLANLRKAGCHCWDGYQMNKQQGEELRAEVLAEVKKLTSTLDQMNLLLQALWREQQGVAKRANGKARV